MKVKSVFRWSPHERLYRIGRIIWRRGKGPGHGAPRNYDAQLTLALCPTLFRWESRSDCWFLRLLGIRIHYERSYGGVIV
jgi:hypothetical protein